MTKKNVQLLSFSLGFSLLVFVFLTILIPSIAFILGGTLIAAYIVIAFLISGVVLYLMLYQKLGRKSFIWITVFLTILAGSLVFGALAIDGSYDGNSYRKAATGGIKNGWNPVYSSLSEKSTENEIIKVIGNGLDDGTTWADDYPKASSIFAASTYSLTGNIETGKALSIIIIAATFLLSFAYFIGKFDRNKAVIIAVLLAFNPITLMQIYSSMNDGIMGNLLIILLVMLTILIDKGARYTKTLLVYATIFIVVTLLINLKFTGLAYAGIVMACYWVYILIRRDWKLMMRVTAVGLISLGFGLLVLGASSYIRNTVVHGNPLYPLIGKDSRDIMTGNQPATYIQKSGLHKFIESNFGETANITYQDSMVYGDSDLKVPFTVSLKEIGVLYGATSDIRQAGYGVWFGGILLVSFIASTYLLIRYGRKYKHLLPMFILPIVTICVTVICFDNTWWARYLPQLCIIPVIVIIALYLVKSKVLSSILVFAVLFNAILGWSLVHNSQVVYKEHADAAFAKYLSCNTDVPVKVFSTSLHGALYNVIDRCENITLISEQEYNLIPENSKVELYAGVSAIKQ